MLYPMREDIDQGNFRLRLELRMKNSELVSAREKLDYTQKRAAEEIGIYPQTLGRYENLKDYPKPETQKRICDFYRGKGIFMLEEDVFPPELQYLKGKTKHIRDTEIPKESLVRFDDNISRQDVLTTGDSLSEYDPEQGYIISLQERQTKKVLTTITPREEKILRMRFGIGERGDYTHEEISDDFSVTRERIRQIEAKALRKMRHPQRKGKLEPFTNPNDF